MKYKYKLVFKDKPDTVHFAIELFQFISQRNDWLRAYEAMRRKNILYIYTHNYSYIDNYINNNSIKYNYQIIKL